MNAEKQEQQYRDQHEINDARDRLNQRHCLNLEAQVPLKKSERPKNSQHAKDFEDVQILRSSNTFNENGQDGEKDHNHVHNIPGVPRITLLAIAEESEKNYINRALDAEQSCEYDVESVQSLGPLSLSIHIWVIHCQKDA